MKGKRAAPEPQFRIRTYASGKVSWEYRYQVGPKGARRTVPRTGFVTKDHARKDFRERVIPALECGFETPEDYEAFQVEEKTLKKWRGICLREFVEAYIDQNSNWSPATLRNMKVMLRHAAREIGEKTLVRRISTSQVKAFMALKTKQGSEPSNDTKLSRLRALSTLLDFAIEQKIIEDNPARTIRKPKAKAGRDVFLTESECRDLLRVCSQYKPRNEVDLSAVALTALVATAIYTGMRLSEVLHLEWQDINRDELIIVISPKRDYGHSTKNGKTRALGFNKDLLTYLDALKEDRRRRIIKAEDNLEQLRVWMNRDKSSDAQITRPDFLNRYKRGPSVKKVESDIRGILITLQIQQASNFLFPNRSGTPYTVLPKSFNRVIESSGLKSKKATFHSLRHTYASLALLNHVPLHGVQKLLGHQNISTTMKYSHLENNTIIRFGQNIPSLSDDEDSSSENEAAVIEIQKGTGS